MELLVRKRVNGIDCLIRAIDRLYTSLGRCGGQLSSHVLALHVTAVLDRPDETTSLAEQGR